MADPERPEGAWPGGARWWEEGGASQAFFRAAPLPVGVLDFDGTARIWNPAAERAFGWSRDEVVGRPLPCVPAEQAPSLRALLERTRRGESVKSVEVAWLRKGGESVWAVLSTAPLEAAGGTRQGMFWIAQDVTDRKKAEEALRRGNEAFEALISASPLAIVTFDIEGVITMWNPAAERMFGWTAGEAIGRFHPIVPEEKKDEFRAFREIARRGGTLAGVEVRRVRKDGSPIDICFFTAPLRDAAGEVKSIMSIIVDVTEQKATEEALRRTQEQLLRAQKMEVVGRLAGGIAHDFNNLLTVINGHTELLQARFDSADPLFREIEEIRRAGERAASLTRQLLAFSRRQVLELRVQDLRDIVSGTEKMLRRLIGEDIDLLTTLGDDPAPIRADGGQVEQVLMNLAVNARDAMPRGGTLSVTVENVSIDSSAAGRLGGADAGEYVRLSVADTGCGMDSDVRSHLFEPFFTTKEHGTGLGLATVYGIVRQSGGFIRVDSAPGKGTTFDIFFPRVGGPAERQEAGKPAASAPGGVETVLVVEDDELVRDLVCEVLRRSGYVVLGACHGAEALHVAELHSGPIHLLLTDVVMPGMGGAELAERLARARPGIKVLYMSGYTDDEALRRGVMGGRKAFIQKPFRAAALAVKVREVLDSPAAL